MSNEKSRIETVNRISAIKAEVDRLSTEIGYAVKNAGHDPVARENAQQLMSKRAALDDERRGLEVTLHRTRDLSIIRVEREIREWIKATGERYRLPEGETESSIEGQAERATVQSQREALAKRLSEYERWTREGYHAAEALIARAKRAIFLPEPVDSTLRDVAREFSTLKGRFGEASILERLLGSEAR